MSDTTRAVAAAFRTRLETWIAPMTDADKHVVLDWVDLALSGDPADENDLNAGLLEGCIDGRIEITRVKDGEVLFRLTGAGLADTEAKIAQSPALQAEHDALVAKFAGRLLGQLPKDPQ